MVVPIDCVPSRIHLSAAAKDEIKKFERALEAFYAQEHCNTLKFERAIRTKGRDHMQAQLVPIPRDGVANALSILLQVGCKFGLRFHEIQVIFT